METMAEAQGEYPLCTQERGNCNLFTHNTA